MFVGLQVHRGRRNRVIRQLVGCSGAKSFWFRAVRKNCRLGNIVLSFVFC